MSGTRGPRPASYPYWVRRFRYTGRFCRSSGDRGTALTQLGDPTPWVRDRVDGPRRTGVLAVSRGGSCSHAILEEAAAEPAPKSPKIGADARAAAWPSDLPLSEGLFVVEGDDCAEIVAGLRGLTATATEAATDPANDRATDTANDPASDPATDTVRRGVIHRLAKGWWRATPAGPMPCSPSP